MERTVKKSPTKMDIYFVLSPFCAILKIVGLMPFSWDKKKRSTKIKIFDKFYTAACSIGDILVIFYLVWTRDTFEKYGHLLSSYGWLTCLVMTTISGEIHMFYLILKRNEIAEIIRILLEFDEKVN